MSLPLKLACRTLWNVDIENITAVFHVVISNIICLLIGTTYYLANLRLLKLLSLFKVLSLILFASVPALLLLPASYLCGAAVMTSRGGALIAGSLMIITLLSPS
jgi:hypothetical protein